MAGWQTAESGATLLGLGSLVCWVFDEGMVLAVLGLEKVAAGGFGPRCWDWEQRCVIVREWWSKLEFGCLQLKIQEREVLEAHCVHVVRSRQMSPCQDTRSPPLIASLARAFSFCRDMYGCSCIDLWVALSC